MHNRHVVDTLTEKGVIFVEETDEVPEGELLVFSAHGVSPAVKETTSQRGLQTIDATCPLVTKVHREAVRFTTRDNYHIILIGHDGHEEVEGTFGHAPESTTIVNGPWEVDQIEVPDPDNLIWLSQTTLSVDETMETVQSSAKGSRTCRTHLRMTSATPRPTVRRRSRRSPRNRI